MRSRSRLTFPHRNPIWRSAALTLAVVLMIPTLVAASPPTNASIIEVPLSMTVGHLAVPVMAADGTELQFMLSTGAPMTLISEAAAARVDVASLTMGGIPITGEDTQVIDDSRLEADGHQFDGIVAATILPDYDVLFDVPNGRMLMRPLGPPADWDGVDLGEPVALRVFHGIVLSTSIQLDGHDYMAQFEIGMNKVIVNGPVTQKLGFEGETTGTVTIAGRDFGDLAVHHIEVPVFERWDPDKNGFVLVGAPLARDCAIAVSWIRAELRVCAQ